MQQKHSKLRLLENKQNLALVLGFVSTLITFLNFLVDID